MVWGMSAPATTHRIISGFATLFRLMCGSVLTLCSHGEARENSGELSFRFPLGSFPNQLSQMQENWSSHNNERLQQNSHQSQFLKYTWAKMGLAHISLQSQLREFTLWMEVSGDKAECAVQIPHERHLAQGNLLCAGKTDTMWWLRGTGND